MIEFAYNDHIHNSIGISPIYVLYGMDYRTSITLSTFNTRFEYIVNMIREMNEIRKSTNLGMKISQNKVKYYIDKKIFL
jgi:hypothetical protein